MSSVTRLATLGFSTNFFAANNSAEKYLRKVGAEYPNSRANSDTGELTASNSATLARSSADGSFVGRPRFAMAKCPRIFSLRLPRSAAGK
jgi:hypothetical protein